METKTVIKCVRCPSEFVAGETVSTDRSLSSEQIIGMVIAQLGWKQTFAGWQCPHHSRS